MTPEELDQIAVTEHEQQSHFTQRVNVCVAAGCLSCQSQSVKDALDKEVAQRGTKDHCQVKGVGCMGLCSEGPLVSTSNGVLYKKVEAGDGAAIIDSLEGSPVSRLVCPTDVPFFQRQQKIVLENSGVIDPDRIEDYIAANGYTALIKALTELTSHEVVDEVTKSGLRGRGGAGYAVGATEAYIYVRAEYPLAIKRLRNAIRQAERVGLLGSEICGTRFSFKIDLRLGAGAFVCGEETALIASVEGKRGTPRPRPPYPAMEGLFGQPTLINNVETFANIVPIIRNGGEWYSKIGTEKSKGTKVFALAGRVENTGLVEVPMGISLREMVYEIGGGIPDGRKFKAVQTGGPSGGCLPTECLDMPVDYESLAKAGSIMGSGGMIVMDENSCMVDVAKYFMDFCMTESCGKCIPCRVGTYQMHRILTAIGNMTATPQDMKMLEELCDLLKHTSLCGLGQSAPNPVVSTLRSFAEEYRAHIEDHKCPAGVCGAQPAEAQSDRS